MMDSNGERTVLRDVVAERSFTLHRETGEREVVVRFGRPEPDPEPGGDWRCALEIRGLGDRQDGVEQVNGVDGVQALLLAMQLAALRLRFRPRGDGDRLTWLEDDEDLGLPYPGERAALDHDLGDDPLH